MASTILIADDDPIQRRLLSEMVKRFGYTPIIVENGSQAITRLCDDHAVKIDVLILDLVMPELDGMGVLTAMRDKNINVPVVVQTSHGSLESVVSAMRAGASDFVVKPVGAERLQISIKNALRVEALEGELRHIKRSIAGLLTFRDLACNSNEMDRVIRLGERAAKSTIPVLLEGESGVGKEVIARAIQGGSDRKGKPFVTVNCGAIPANLIESLLFGHEKGAFTGATEKHVGKFVEANGGTLFLDEIGELPLEAQVKLLRAIQESEVDPVGAKKSVKVDIRLISATNANLIEAVKQGRFREDLYYRLNVFPIHVPPLRMRRDDIPNLARRFLARFAAEEGKTIRIMSSEALALLKAFQWPGNVRQLENAIFRAVVLCDGDELGVQDFPQIAAHVEGFDVRIPSLTIPTLMPTAQHNATNQLARVYEREIVQVLNTNSVALVDQKGDLRKLEEVEKDTIKFAIDFYRGQMSKVARKLGIGRSTLYRKLNDLGLVDADVHNEEREDEAYTSKVLSA